MDDAFIGSDRRDSAVKARLTAALQQITAQGSQSGVEDAFPDEPIELLANNGLLKAYASPAMGGEIFPDHARYVASLFDCLRLIGRTNLSLGRIFEGHVNAVLLIEAYGDGRMRDRLAVALREKQLFGVWNTEPQPGMSLEVSQGQWTLSGAKNYATGTGHLDFAVITARHPDGHKQMLVAPVGSVKHRADPGSWKTSGMRGTVSGTFDFSNLRVSPSEFLGSIGDYEREPMFTAGAWRFTAVQVGGIEAIVRSIRNHIRRNGAADDPIHRARFARAVAQARTAYLWVREAANRAELSPDNDAIAFVLMARGVVEDAALAVIEAAQRSVGTQAFFTGNPIDREIRDLQLYLRQPVPDQARDRASRAWLDRDSWADDPWW